ncbi:hypothetical protein UFOVP641_34 [uncultured Caudovirales phage]|uniref:Uncharacterized protein n=1 Tax=uncultured Caudovirales phage TaxID=2100421 RepID=A0A6J5N9V3_9CAUD|nr:hypothetical protein UFOVP641_34 [uncultured Caudovirales phage]
MMTIKVSGAGATSTALAASFRSEIRRLATDLFTEIKQRTPVDTGRARAGWNKAMGNDSFVIINNVPYTPVLDKGRHMTSRGIRGSKQAPKGIVGPSLDAIKRKN